METNRKLNVILCEKADAVNQRKASDLTGSVFHKLVTLSHKKAERGLYETCVVRSDCPELFGEKVNAETRRVLITQVIQL